tara:strand:- start:387 stop:1913 length:1527 start_codon:yes stop_codon:yes gene_type:complete
MPVLRYTASADTTIVNAFQPNLTTRGTGANAGEADVMEVFSIYGRQASGSQELSRILLKFPTTSIAADRTASTIPASGSVSFYLRVFNAPTSKTVPTDFKLVVAAVSQSWQEGIGLDLEGYADLTRGNTGANWMSASDTAAWSVVGGSYLTSSADLFKEQTFANGLEDMDLDITPIVESWLDSTQENYGVEILLSQSYEAYYSSSTGQNTGSIINNLSGATTSYYTKRFFARGSQYFFKRPTIEARWSDVTRDDRGEFYLSSSRAPAADNLNTLYFYNIIRGKLVNLPVIGTGSIYVSLYSGSSDNSTPDGTAMLLYNGSTALTGGYVSTGIYSCSVGITSSTTITVSPMYDVWFSSSTEYFTGSILPKTIDTGMTLLSERYIIDITNLKNSYHSLETSRFNLYVRNKNWNPNVYTVVQATPEGLTIQSASYRVYRVSDGLNVVGYGTGSDLYTGLSHDVSGNYFNFDMKLLEPGYTYAFKFAFYDEQIKSWEEQVDSFKFRVEKSNQ